MAPIGYMAMPDNFKYKNVFLKGKPHLVNHYPMPAGQRAKLFSPFDALEGFGENVKRKTVLYEDKRQPEDLNRFNQTLARLQSLTINSKEARKNKPIVKVSFYTPCADEENFAFGIRGQYETLSGVCWNVDPIFQTIKIDDTVISFDDLYDIKLLKKAA